MRKLVMLGRIESGCLVSLWPEIPFVAVKIKGGTMAVRPAIDHYMGRTVEAINEAYQESHWAIELQGGARIVNLNPEYDAPDDSLVGMKLSFQTLGLGMTALYFGTDENPRGTVVYLEPTQYGLSDPNYEEGRMVRPQSSVEERDEAELPVADDERIVSGPDLEWDQGDTEAAVDHAEELQEEVEHDDDQRIEIDAEDAPETPEEDKG